MPLIMEDGINMDDLFGEPNSLELGMPAASPIKGLAQCLDEMRLLGCCQKIVWSRMGCIASISQDGLRVNVRYLQCRPSDGKWVLGEETSLAPVLEAHNGNQLAHISWNETGSELAVVDCSGRISIYSISIALNSITGLRQASFDSGDDGSQVVGMMWLNTYRHIHAFHQAAKVNGRWAYSPFRRRSTGPFHPANKGALICVTRAGQIKLIYQNPDSKWAELPAELKNTGYSDRLLTHASMTATQDGILLSTYSACQKMCLYRVDIGWNPSQWEPTLGKPPGQFPVPTFRLIHCKVDMPSNILNVNRGPDHSDQSLPFLNSVYSLTRLEIMPGQFDSLAGSTANPWILAVLSKPLHAIHDYPDQQGPPSVILRWHLESAPQILHAKFDEVPSKKSNAEAKPKMELRRLEDIYCDKYIVSVDLIEHGAVLAVSHDDSSITCYETRTMTVLNGLGDSSTVTCLAQAGFHYPLETSGLHIAFSPNACVAVTLDVDGHVQLRVMEHSFGSTEGLYDENNFSAAIAALTLAFSRGCGIEVNTDDILMVACGQLSPEARTTFISEVYRALPVNCNFTAEQDKLMSHPYIPRCLSLQAGLGFKGRLQRRNLSSAVPWASLQLRHASVLFAYFFQYNKGGQTESHDPDVLRMVLGNTKWTLDFSHFLLNEIFDMADEFEDVFNDPEAFTQKLKNSSSLPLLVLLASMSRAFLRFICRGLRGVHAGFASTNPASLVGDSRVYYTEICQTLESSPVRIDVYEKFLAGVDSAVKHAYQGAGFGDAERPGPEKELLVNARIPPVLTTAVATLLRQTVPALKSEINRMAIYLGDYSWLGFGNDRRTALYRKQREVDILKKCPLRPPLPLGIDGRVALLKKRRCVRCTEVSGDTNLPRSLLSFKMIAKLSLLRSCLCGGMWVLETDTGDVGVRTASTNGNGNKVSQS
ncbi:Mediator complex subunit Med16 [Penicillium chrysogenum]|uniref:Mediator of RNA polymerase II transcription subunit 16 n=1 Tax=Penicillium chrysogenum TaxID=5076 RepID=A0ABQ8WU11_PENCH|nr:Mediator complex subunit Med16 [Penicillium chrysogenum]KAJ5285718.1 Mediator complex subunit Med16 [Penicillium chrysogenum]KAJ6156951.1 Mediator complex subunit Med16 [Penicillium chrysogenum]